MDATTETLRRISRDEFAAAVHRVSSSEPTPLDRLITVIPRADRLQPAGPEPAVLIRTDLDVPVRHGQVADDARLVAAIPVIDHCLDRGWKVVLFGHIGRTSEASLKPVREALQDILGRRIRFVDDWIDEEANGPTRALRAALEEAPRPGLVMLENARKYSTERFLWKATPEEREDGASRLFELAARLRNAIADIEINESIAASNLDFSSSVLPLVMGQTAMGLFLHQEFQRHIPEVLKADFIVFSGLKMDKLNDLERMLSRRSLKELFVGGALAMPFLKARARRAGSNVSIGRVERDADLKAYVGPDRIDQAERILQTCEGLGVRLSLPKDFVLDDGSVATTIPADRVQMDAGPATIREFASLVSRYTESARRGQAAGIVFYNGVFGKFEEDRFSVGTEVAIRHLSQMTRAGLKTFVGGGEGRLALLRYGSADAVTHAFTAGGTVLKCLGGRPIGYLEAMYLQNTFARDEVADSAARSRRATG